MSSCVEIEFDCLPLRSIGRVDIPLDASPAYQAKCERLKRAIEKHGTHNSFYLHNASCKFYLTNNPEIGSIEFTFVGTVLTDELDQKTVHADLDVKLERETCDWLTEPIVHWFHDSVRHAVIVEFDQYIQAGDLQQTLKRLEKLREETDKQGGYMGMYL
jgi:hypothetical protein